MNLLVRNEYRAEIILSSPELESYGITYEEIDYGNIETRRLLWTLQKEVQKIYGYRIKLSGKMLIEVIKDTDDLVRICFSVLSPKEADDNSVKQLIKSCPSPLIAEFPVFEEMLEAVSCIDIHTKSSLFESNGKYRICFYTDEETKIRLTFSLCEFAQLFENSPTEAAHCSEMWNFITDDAVSSLQRLF